MSWKKVAMIAFIGILLGVMSWSLYRIIYESASDVLFKVFGIANTYAQNVTVFLVALILLIILGVSGKKILKKITG